MILALTIKIVEVFTIGRSMNLAEETLEGRRKRTDTPIDGKVEKGEGHLFVFFALVINSRGNMNRREGRFDA